MSELKPCPFCGSSPEMNVNRRAGRDFHHGEDVWFLACSNPTCIAHSMAGMYSEHGKELLMQRWNRRTATGERDERGI